MKTFAEIFYKKLSLGKSKPASTENTRLNNNILPAQGEIYRGYSDEDINIFDNFAHIIPSGTEGYVTDFIGTKTKTSSLWDAARIYDGKVMSVPIPNDLFETIEWIGLLKSVLGSKDSSFAMMELGAGWGPWLAAGATAARVFGTKKLKLLGVEADPGRFDLLKQNMTDNDLSAQDCELICAAVGESDGHARWPWIGDPANAGGARPIRNSSGALAQSDIDYMQSTLDNHREVRVVSIMTLLGKADIWDLVHIDVQGWELELCGCSIQNMTTNVKWVVVGTHSRYLDGALVKLFHETGWILENEKPTQFHFNSAVKSLDSMAITDGTQVWRNPKLT